MFAWVENPIVGTQVITWGASTALEFTTCDNITADTVSQQHRKSILMREGGGSQHECFRALGRCPYTTNMEVQSISSSQDMMPTWFHGLCCSDMLICIMQSSIDADISFGSLNATFLVHGQAVSVKAFVKNMTSHSQHLSCIYLTNEDGPFS